MVLFAGCTRRIVFARDGWGWALHLPQRKVSAREVLKDKHVAIYFGKADEEDQYERERRLQQRKQGGVASYVRSEAIVKQVEG